MKIRINKSQQALSKTYSSTVMKYIFRESYIWFMMMM